MPDLAAAQAMGQIGPEHVVIARKALAKIPATVGATYRQRAEHDLAVLASQFGPETFQRLAEHLVAVLDPDGDFTDRERLAQRGLRLGRQGIDGMSSLSGRITPELRATLEPILAKLAAPGCATPPTNSPVSVAPHPNSRSSVMTADPINAPTTPYSPLAARCSPAGTSANSTGCR